ncbi:MAG: hypothetical protein ACFFAS_05690 [Promethearchaeota archaeon]
MFIIPIDWIKAQEKPNERQKIEGKILMDLREKMDRLEREVVSLSKQLKDVSKKEVVTKRRSHESDEHLESVSELYKMTKEELDSLREKLKLAKQEQEVLKNLNSKLQNSLIKIQKENIDFDTKIENIKSEQETEIERAVYDLVKQISQKNKQIEQLQIDLEQSEKRIQMVNDGLETTIQDQLKMIEKLRSNLTRKTNSILDSARKIAELEERALENEISGQIIRRIKQILFEKGFLSDKEFEQIYSEHTRDQLIANM